jgi:hypothetical protein
MGSIAKHNNQLQVLWTEKPSNDSSSRTYSSKKYIVKWSWQSTSTALHLTESSLDSRLDSNGHILRQELIGRLADRRPQYWLWAGVMMTFPLRRWTMVETWGGAGKEYSQQHVFIAVACRRYRIIFHRRWWRASFEFPFQRWSWWLLAKQLVEGRLIDSVTVPKVVGCTLDL